MSCDLTVSGKIFFADMRARTTWLYLRGTRRKDKEEKKGRGKEENEEWRVARWRKKYVRKSKEREIAVTPGGLGTSLLK